MGFVLVRLILLRLDRTYTRRVGLRAANLNDPVGVLSVLSVLFFCRRLSSFCLLCSFVLSRVFSRAFGWPGVSSLSSRLFSLCLSPAVDLCVRLGSCLFVFLSAVKPFVRPRVSLYLSSVSVGGCSRVSRQALSCGFAWRFGECLCSLFFSIYCI